VLAALVEEVKARAGALGAAVAAAEEAAAALGGSDLVVDWTASKEQATIGFLGYAWERVPSTVSGLGTIRYDESRPETWRVPLVTKVDAAIRVRVPRAGYVVPPAHADRVIEKLTLHGIESRRLEQARPSFDVATFRAAEVEFAKRPYEGCMTAKVRGRWSAEKRDLPAGALFVPVAQPRARLLVHLLDPEAPDSLVSWGFFNSMFEKKEYLELYVAEEIAAGMMRDDPALKTEFLKRLQDDEAFAKDPAQRLEFFHRRHPSWDDRPERYPVMRVDAAP
jgi:hypothetical protein